MYRTFCREREFAMKRRVFRLFSILLVCLLAFPPLPAHAAEDVARIGDTLYPSLSEAAAHAQPGDTITLLSDSTVSEEITFPEQLTLDGNAYRLTLSSSACLHITGDFYAQNLQIESSRNTRSGPTLSIEGQDITCTLTASTLHCLDSRRGPSGTALISFSATDSRLSLENCTLTSALNQSAAIEAIGDCADSEIALDQVDIAISPDSGTARSCYALYVDAADSPLAVSLTDCMLRADTAVLAIGEGVQPVSATLAGCTLEGSNALRLTGEGGSYTLEDCVCSDAQTDAGQTAGLVYVSDTAKDNVVTFSQSTLDCASDSATPCVLSLENADNQFHLSAHTRITVNTDTADLVHINYALADRAPVTADDSVDLSDFPVVWQDADGRLCNATTALLAAAPLWRAGDTITLRGALAGALDLQEPVTLVGEQARFSGSLAIRDADTAIHGLDLSESAVDCAAGCDLSYNYWGSLTPPAHAVVSPYYVDAACQTLAYAPVGDTQAAQEVERFVQDVQSVLTRADPESSLASFDPLTDGDLLTAYADPLLSARTRLAQSTTAEQRADACAASPDLAAALAAAWRVYWSGVGVRADDTVIDLSSGLTPSGTDSQRAGITENAAARMPVSAISADGAALAPDDPVLLHGTLTAWAFGPLGELTQLTFETSLVGPDGLPLAGDGVYRLPVPTQACESLRATVDGEPVEAIFTVSPAGYPYVTLGRCGTVVLSLTYASSGEQPAEPTDPDQPADPDHPQGPVSDPDQTGRFSVSLRTGPHGSLHLHTRSPAPGDLVRVTAEADRGYALDTLDVIDSRGRALDFDLEDDTLRFRMPESDVRVTARFARADRTDTTYESQTDLDDPLPPLAEQPAGDLAPDAWYWADVREITARGWMDPLLAGAFCPDLPASRIDLVRALYRMAGQPQDAAALPFSDIAAGSPDQAAVTWARAAGIARGEPDGRFRPYDPVTREECVALLYRFAGSPAQAVYGLPFSDAGSVSAWARPAMQWAYQGGILYGNAEGTCTPLAPVSRAESAALLLRLARALGLS